MIPNREYDIVPYNPAWPEMYEREAAVVRKVFGDFVKDIQHVGSTSVPGMQAKPQIDVLVIVDDITTAEQLTPDMQAQGYTAFGDPFGVGCRTFSRVSGNVKLSNVHVHVPGNSYVQQFLLIRDYLRAHPERAKAYGELKVVLKQQFPGDYRSYAEGKKDFLQDLFEEAQAFSGQS
jgi:GrpB-like predicted nucleotidyltransferase (UPF0157 family)